MNHWKIGVLGAADIAYRRFLPALSKSGQFTFAGVASRDSLRCKPFLVRFRGQCYPDYQTLLQNPEIDCIYLPLPPALHMEWGLRVLGAGKHLLMEKPFTTREQDTKTLLAEAKEKGLAVHENYMFLYHRQLQEIQQVITSGALGKVRMIRSAFTFPHRSVEDFRYDPNLGGGALLDCGGYPLRLAVELLGDTAKLRWSHLQYDPANQVDTAGSAVLQNESGLTAHIFWGMDDTYRCELEVWGSKASLTAPRIFTAPPECNPVLYIHTGNEIQEITVDKDDQFLNSISCFASLLEDVTQRPAHNADIARQSWLVQQIQNQNGRYRNLYE